jgi:hypothetical protein
VVRVFLSHAADAQADDATRLASDLRAADVAVWMAPDSVRPGEPFSTAIDQGLAGSDYFLVLLSPAALVSRWVQTEVNAALIRALRGEIEVLPLVVTAVAVPPLLSTFQQIDFTDYQRGLSDLGNRLGVSLTAGTIAAPSRSALPGRPHGRRPPADAFIATVRADLDRGAGTFGYAVHRADAAPGSIVDSIVEVALLRIGVAVWPAAPASSGQILAAVSRELRSNPHRVAGILAVHSGESTTLTPHQLIDAPSPNAIVMVWNESDGADAVGAGIDLVARILTGRDPSGR